MSIKGFSQLQTQLQRLGAAGGGKAVRNAASRAMLPALHAARAAAPVGSPPYGPYDTRTTALDPYPKKTYKGRLVTPGFGQRNVFRKSLISRDKTIVRVLIGVRPEAFYLVVFEEFGTSHRAARPWLEPSFRGAIPAVLARFRDQLRANLTKALKS